MIQGSGPSFNSNVKVALFLGVKTSICFTFASPTFPLPLKHIHRKNTFNGGSSVASNKIKKTQRNFVTWHADGSKQRDSSNT